MVHITQPDALDLLASRMRSGIGKHSTHSRTGTRGMTASTK